MIQARLTSYLKIVLFILIAGLSNILISGCENSSENKTEEQIIDDEDPGEDNYVYEDRIVYLDSEGACRAMDFDGASELLFDMTKIGDGLNFIYQYSINGIKNKLIYYDSKTNAIYISNLDGSGKKKIDVNVTSGRVYPQWSPDGQFALCRDGGSFYKIDADGNNSIRLEKESAQDLGKINNAWLSNFVFSSDSKLFSYVTADARKIIVRNVDGSVIKSYPVYQPDDPVISPAGDRVYYKHTPFNTGLRNVSFTDLQNDSIHKITPDSLFVNDFCLSPDGNTAIISATRSGIYYSLYKYDVQTDSLSVLLKDGFNHWYAVFSSDSKKIIWQYYYGAISIMNTDGNERRDFENEGKFLCITRFRVNK